MDPFLIYSYIKCHLFVSIADRCVAFQLLFLEQIDVFSINFVETKNV